MKIAISIISQGGPPESKAPQTREERVKRLLAKIDYAKDCIEYDHRKAEAIKFLQELHRDLLRHKSMRDDTQHLIEKCYQVIRDYGILPLEPTSTDE